MVKLFGVRAFAVLLTSAVAVYVLMPRGVALPLSAVEEIPAVIQDGDVICRLGDRFWSQLFKNVSPLDRRFSHTGIARVQGGRVTVIHAEGDTGQGRDFVQEEALGDFLKIARAVGIYRFNNGDGALMAFLAMEYIGIPFDWQFDLNDGSSLYCTELIDAVLSRLPDQKRLEPVFFKEAGKEIIPLESVSRSEFFTEVFYSATETGTSKSLGE
jgi:hypothetical protein